MLILSRNVGEVICIGDDIQVRVLGCRGQQVRIGIEAPQQVPVHRQEVYMRLQAQSPGLSPMDHSR